MSGEQRRRLLQHDSKDVPRFAPNFTVYVLPGDTVCLYSEDRKFFLHGQLYCALASAIAKGKKSFREITRDLAREFPADKIDEAVRRLVDRRFVVPKTRAPEIAAAYWASMGLSPHAAEISFQNCRVRIQSIDVGGAAQLSTALRALGVRVNERSAELTITLVGDYLDERLAELNREHLLQRTHWLLVQPSGIFPLVGPVLRPGEGACWMCLAERMRRNREVKAMLDRAAARPLVVSPLAHNTMGHAGTGIAAAEIAKAIATDFRTDLCDHIISLDLLGSTVARHYVTWRPQCPACGRKKLRDPRRAAVPIEIGTGAKLVTTSGGYRTISSRATVERFRKHVSPLTGVVSRLEPIKADLPLNTNYFATHNFSWRPGNVDELRAGVGGGSFGKGSTAEQGEASALMEAIERYSGVLQGDEIRGLRRFADFRPGEAIHPDEVLLFSEAQYGHPPNVGAFDHAQGVPARFDVAAQIEWSPVWSLRDRTFRYLPTALLYFFHREKATGYRFHADSNGCAAGNTLEEAIVQGFLELVERDAYAIWWYNRVQRPGMDLNQIDDAYVRDLRTQFAATGRRLWVLDISSDLGIPTFVSVAHWIEDAQEFIDFGSGAHFDARIALLRSLTELNQFLSIGLMGGRDQSPSQGDHDHAPAFRLQEHAYLVPSGSRAQEGELGPKFARLDTREQVSACVDVARRAGLDFLVLDQTRPDIEAPVVRVIVPGLRHFYRRFAPGRLYDVPVKLGWRTKPIAESELNPLHPQT